MAIQIPAYDSQVGMNLEAPGVPGPLESVEQAGARAAVPGLRAVEFGKQVAEADKTIATSAAQITERLDHGRAITDLGEMALQMHQRLNKASNEIQADVGAPETWSSRYEEAAAKVRQEVGGLSQNPQALAVFNKEWGTIYPAKLQEITAKARVQDSKNFTAGFDEKYPQYVELYAQATDDLSRAHIQDTVTNYIGSAVAAGILNPEKAAAARLNFIPEAMKARALADIAINPVAAQAKLSNFKENYPGMTNKVKVSLDYHASGAVDRVQKANYANYMQNILGATAEQPVPGASVPTEQEILPQIGKTLNVAGAQNILAWVRGQKDNPDNKTDPQSYKEMATRLTNPNEPLTREEFLKNVESGEWKFDARTYGTVLGQIQAKGSKLDKATDTAYRSRLGFWKTQFGGDTKSEQFMTAVGQAQMAKDAGELGTTPEEVYKNLDSIFKPNADLYAKENFLGRGGTSQQPKQGIIGRAWDWATGGGQAGPETVSRDGKIYRVWTIKGKKMVDPNPLP